MPYCPSCRSEFEADTKLCTECEVQLVDQLDDPDHAVELLDVYTCYDSGEAERVAEVLVREGIETLIRDRSSSSFPTTVGKTAQQIIAVSRSEARQARSLIHTAIDDGVISSHGELLAE